ncbi:serine hydrolase domain-containing protein [Pedobacter sp. NJ-S-72]
MKQIAITIGIFLFFIINTFAQLHIDTSSTVKDNPDIYALLVLKKDKIIAENYFNKYNESKLFNDQSLTKSICSVLIGIAIDKGYIKSVDENLIDFFPELKNDPDLRKQTLTIRQVMNQASGLYHEDLNRIGNFLKLPEPAAYVLKEPLVSNPGDVFHYNNAASHLLSVILTKSTGMDTHLFAKKYLFDPMGISQFEWAKMNDGYDDGSGLLSIRLRAEDLLTVGALILHNGLYRGKQLVPSQWINLITHPDVQYKTEWGFARSAYALCFYHTKYNGVEITYGMDGVGSLLWLFLICRLSS